ncbi:MAG TPA: TA system VapC family ribonuclease toxin [Actinomycetales bacterium]|nr:TA system VapC family ribonuclease toxin [Actinomycetales bacterium]
MIAVDTNILVYAHRREMAQHQRANRALAELAEGDELWALPVFVIGEFLRVVTRPGYFHPPTTRDVAVGTIDSILASPTVRVLHPGRRYWRLLLEALDEGDAKGNLVLDAELVAVCREHGVTTVLSEDRDFRRFPSMTLRTLPPGEPAR